MTTWICALGDYSSPVHDEPPVLKSLVREALGESVRRIDRFIELALIGVGRCISAERLPEGTGVYTGSARGDLQVTLDVVEPLFRSGQRPKPLSFVNTVSNATNFYIARQFGLAGPSNFVSHLHFAFESALDLAVVSMEAGRLHSALVGSVDVVTAPVAEHRRRLGVSEDTVVGEGSHWIWLRQGARPADALAELQVVRQFRGPGDFTEWLSRVRLPRDAAVVTAESCADPVSLDEILAQAGLLRRPTTSDAAYYGSRSGAALGDFLRASGEEYLLHLNMDPDDGRMAVMLARRL